LSPAAKDAGFLTADWTAVPKVGFERVVFRQLEEQPSARVFDDSVGFELADYERRPKAVPQPVAATPDFTVDAKPSATLGSEAAEGGVAASSEATVSAAADAGTDDASQDCAITQTPDPSSTERLFNENDGQAAADAAQTDPAMLAQLREQAFQEGLAQGLAQGHSQGLAQGLAEGEALGRAQGETDGEARGVALGLQQAEQAQAPQMLALQEQMQAQLDPELALLREVTQRLQALVENPQDLYEPLKRLALHVAEQLVLAELTLSGSAIERLVQRCVDDLGQHDESMVTVHLHPSDVERLHSMRERTGLNEGSSLRLQADETLLPGSVRASANDAIVEDLIGERLSTLARGLQIDAPRWNAHTAFSAERIAADRLPSSRVEDAQPRMAAAVAASHSASPDDVHDVHDVHAPSGHDTIAAIDEILNDENHV
jgi:flagellar biosynthesis/type III secretory pathway protein FliH